MNWFPTEHWFLQFGAGYYRLGSHEQLVAMVHINLANLIRPASLAA